MAAKWIGFIVFIWLIGSIVGLIAEGAVVSANETTTLNQIMFWQEVRSDETWTPVAFIEAIPDFFSAIWKALTWQYNFFEGDWAYIRLILLSPIIATVVIGMIITFFGIFSRNV